MELRVCCFSFIEGSVFDRKLLSAVINYQMIDTHLARPALHELVTGAFKDWLIFSTMYLRKNSLEPSDTILPSSIPFLVRPL